MSFTMCKYKVGDYVRIKDWDSLVEEFGYDQDNYIINTRCGFLEDFKPLCGKTVKIARVGEKWPDYCLDLSETDLTDAERSTVGQYDFDIGAYRISDDEISGYQYNTNRNFYESLDDFGQMVYLVNFVRKYSDRCNVDLYSRAGHESAKKAFKEHLDLPYIEIGIE